MRIPTLTEILALYAAHGWSVDEDRRNLLVIRRSHDYPGADLSDDFDDMLIAFTPSKSYRCRVTADPGRPSIEAPKRRDGTAVWAPGFQWRCLGLGKHHGGYACLVPVVPITVLRYTSPEDPTGERSTSSSTQIHRASATKESTVVGPWSEGCIVVANPADYSSLMSLLVAGLLPVSVALVVWDGRAAIGGT